MATLTTSWKSYASASYTASAGAKVTFYLEARYSTQSVSNNTTTVYTRLKSTITGGTLRGSGYSFSCTYCNTKSGTGVWTFRNEEIISSPAKTITHNTDGTKSISLSATAKNTYWNINKSMSATVDLPKINRIATVVSAPDFTDEENPTITYTNPLGNSVTGLAACISLTGATDDISYRDIPKTGTSYTFELTETERNVLRQATANSISRSIKFFVRTNINGTNYYSSLQKTLTIVNADPTQETTFVETNSKIVNLLGSSSADTIVKNASTLTLTTTPSLKKSATLKRIDYTNGTKTDYDTTSPYNWNVTPISNTFKVKVTDSRTLSSETTYTKTMIDYEPIYILSVSFKRYAPTSSDVILNAEIKYKQATFGSTANVPTIKWKKGEDGQENTLSTSDYTVDTQNNKITISNLTLTDAIPYNNDATFYLLVQDLLTSHSDADDVRRGIPTFEAGEHDFQVNGDLYIADTDRQNIVDGGKILRARNEIITIGLLSDITINPTTDYQYTKLNLTSEIGKLGQKLTISNGAIKIGAGISKIKVCANTVLQGSTQATGMAIFKNNVETYRTFMRTNQGSFISCSIVDGVLDVEENDTISLYVYTTTTSESRLVKAYDGYGTYLTVEAIY